MCGVLLGEYVCLSCFSVYRAHDDTLKLSITVSRLASIAKIMTTERSAELGQPPQELKETLQGEQAYM